MYKPRKNTIRQAVLKWVDNKKFRPFSMDDLQAGLRKIDGRLKYSSNQIRWAFEGLKKNKIINNKGRENGVYMYTSKINKYTPSEETKELANKRRKQMSHNSKKDKIVNSDKCQLPNVAMELYKSFLDPLKVQNVIHELESKIIKFEKNIENLKTLIS